MESPQRARVVTFVVLVLSVAGLVACAESGSHASAPGEIIVYMTDAPTTYDNVWVTMDDLQAHKSGGEWFSVPLTSTNADTNGDAVDDVIVNPDGSLTIDLLALQGVQALFASGTIASGQYTQLRLKVLSAEAVETGTPVPLEVPSGAQTGIKLVGQFKVDPGQTVSLLLDFDAEASIILREGSGKPPLLKPVIKVTLGGGGGGTPPGGEVFTWGWNDRGQLGNGVLTNSPVPGQVLDPSHPSGILIGVVRLGSGWNHTPALLSGCILKTWGENTHGELGDGSTTDRPIPVRVVDPSDTSGFLTGVLSAYGGAGHTAAVMEDGTVKTWGWNASGQLGDGTLNDRSIPGLVLDPADPSGLLTSVVAVGASASDSTVALMADGTVRAWGRNDTGELGDGTGIDSPLPVQVADPGDPSGLLTGVTEVAGGGGHLAALKDDGTVRTWGSNFVGQLGDGAFATGWAAVQVIDPNDPTGFLSNVVSVACGGNHTVALLADGTLMAWGWNDRGQLGVTGWASSSEPLQVEDPSDATGVLRNVVAIAGGDKHSLALIVDGTVRAWGWNDGGQLGDGTTVDNPYPVKVVDPSHPTGYLSGVADVAAGSKHSLAVR